jgi:hypothetical protein
VLQPTGLETHIWVYIGCGGNAPAAHNYFFKFAALFWVSHTLPRPLNNQLSLFVHQGIQTRPLWFAVSVLEGAIILQLQRFILTEVVGHTVCVSIISMKPCVSHTILHAAQ